MNAVAFRATDVDSTLMWFAVALATVAAALVLVERAVFALQQVRLRRLERRYAPLVLRALADDTAAADELAASPPRHRLAILRFIPIVERYLRSWRWWRRALALHALGLVQARDHTAAIVAALDDPNANVRAAALDALTDLCDPASLQAVAVRLHDPSLPAGRRAAALAAFGCKGEIFLLDLAEVDAAHRANYASALALCGTARARPALARWTEDPRAEVSAAALEALARIGVDGDAARLAIAALEHKDARVRAMAAQALRGWAGDDAAAHLAGHLDDEWPVALRAARALQSSPAGVVELQARTSRTDLTGVLARQMLWQGAAQW
ncbi:MAG: HEAT repeat domain-containing protein [Acidobacteria bacterium]|nr:HEAT repeat domain-containing protein [Acidobacteriota bacterium]